MELRTVLLLVGLGVVAGFVVRSSLRILMKVAVLLVALALVHMASPDGIPRIVSDGFGWLGSLARSLVGH